MPADVRSLATRVLSVAPPPPADVRSLAVRVLSVAPPDPADVRSLAVRVLVSPTELRQPGQYVKADDGEWYPMAQFPWTT